MNRNKRIDEECRTVEAMIRLYCRKRHRCEICPECRELLDYAICRLEHCPQAEAKPTCAGCTIHCYRPEMRESIRNVMRFSGPRMIIYHPIMAIRHIWREITN